MDVETSKIPSDLSTNNVNDIDSNKAVTEEQVQSNLQNIPANIAPPPGIILPQSHIPIPSMNTSFNPLSNLDEAERYYWREYKDKNNRPFYYHSKLNISTWIRPKQFLTREERLRPVSTLKLGDSDWKVVNTFGGSKYYYNYKTKETSWDFPESVSEMVRQQYENRIKERNEKKRAREEQEKKKKEEKEELEYDEESDEESFSKRQKQVEDFDDEQKKIIDSFKDLSYDEKRNIFFELLKESGVNHESTWSTVYPDICDDPRFMVLSSNNERRALVDNYIKKCIKEFKRQTKSNIKEGEKKLIKLIDKAIRRDNKLMWKDFKEKYQDHEVFKLIKNENDAEMTFHIRKGQINAENKEAHDLACQLFLQMLEEKAKPTILKEKNIKWSKIKYDFRDDDRYFPDLLSRKDRESIFKEFKDKILKEC